jgi:hypothetical protein
MYYSDEMKEVGMSGICTILADTKNVIIILDRKSEGSGQLRRHTRRQQVTIELITKKRQEMPSLISVGCREHPVTGFCKDENKLFI